MPSSSCLNYGELLACCGCSRAPSCPNSMISYDLTRARGGVCPTHIGCSERVDALDSIETQNTPNAFCAESAAGSCSPSPISRYPPPLTQSAARIQRDSARWPEQSAVHYLWTAAEDYVLSAWIDFALRHGPSHLSLHYDGIRVSLPEGTTADDFASKCAEHIKDHCMCDSRTQCVSGTLKAGKRYS